MRLQWRQQQRHRREGMTQSASNGHSILSVSLACHLSRDTILFPSSRDQGRCPHARGRERGRILLLLSHTRSHNDTERLLHQLVHPTGGGWMLLDGAAEAPMPLSPAAEEARLEGRDPSHRLSPHGKSHLLLTPQCQWEERTGRRLYSWEPAPLPSASLDIACHVLICCLPARISRVCCGRRARCFR